MNTESLIQHWRFRVHRMQLAHYEAARKFEHKHLWLGLPAVGISTIVGTSVFAALSEKPDVKWQILVGLLSVLSAVLAGLQTFLRYSELTEKHRLAGAKFANLKHQIEISMALPPADGDAWKLFLTDLEEKWARLRDESPTVPGKIWRHIEAELTFEKHGEKYDARKKA